MSHMYKSLIKIALREEAHSLSSSIWVANTVPPSRRERSGRPAVCRRVGLDHHWTLGMYVCCMQRVGLSANIACSSNGPSLPPSLPPSGDGRMADVKQCVVAAAAAAASDTAAADIAAAVGDSE